MRSASDDEAASLRPFVVGGEGGLVLRLEEGEVFVLQQLSLELHSEQLIPNQRPLKPGPSPPSSACRVE